MKDLFDLFMIVDAGNQVEHDHRYLRHSFVWIKREFLSLDIILKQVVPILTRIQKSLKKVTKETEVCGWYFNHIVKTYILYLVTFFHTRDNQKTMERIGYILNIAYKNSSGFGGRERANPIMMKVAGTTKVISVNRKIDTIVGTQARVRIQTFSKRKEFNKK